MNGEDPAKKDAGITTLPCQVLSPPAQWFHFFFFTCALVR